MASVAASQPSTIGDTMRNRLPLVISITAFVVAVLGATPLGHAAYNAVVPSNSVGAAQLRNGAVTSAKLRGDAVTSGKVKNRSLKAIDFADGQIPVGPKGDKGDKGDKGSKGSAGEPGATTVVVRRKIVTKQAGGGTTFMAYDVACATGEHAIGGGAGLVSGGSTSGVTLVSSVPAPNAEGASPSSWKAGLSITNSNALDIGFFVVCAQP